MCSRPRDEAGRFLPATNIIPTPTSNPIENSRIARPVDDDFDARVRASVTRTLTPMFEQLLNRLDVMETRIAARYNSTSPARDLPSPPRHSELAYVDRRQHVVTSSILDKDEARIQRDPKQHVAPTPEPTSTSAEPSPRRTESSETAAEDVCDISFGDLRTEVSGEIVASKLATVTTQIPGDMPILKTDEPKSTSAESSPRRTESSETATEDFGLGNINSGFPKTDELMSGDITPSELATTTPIPEGDITTDDGIDGIEPSDSNDRVDTTDVFRNALQILGGTSGTLFKVKNAFPCPITHYDVDWGGSFEPQYGYMAADGATKLARGFKFTPRVTNLVVNTVMLRTRSGSDSERDLDEGPARDFTLRQATKSRIIRSHCQLLAAEISNLNALKRHWP
ncbi:hypothetical protein V8E54_013829 [Elaphomyces granulatus]